MRKRLTEAELRERRRVRQAQRTKNGKRLPPIHVKRSTQTQPPGDSPKAAVKTVHISELTTLKMVTGNERRYRSVIEADHLIEWVGFGWICIRKATPEDVRKWPRVVRGHVK